MSKFVLNVRHRPTMSETIEDRFAHFISVVRGLPLPWGLADGKELKLPPVGSALATHAKLRGKLGPGVSGDLKFQYRAAGNLDDRAADDDSVVVEFRSDAVTWDCFVNEGFTGFVSAMGAYIGYLYRWDESPEEWKCLQAVAKQAAKNLDGRDGLFRFGPVSFMDRELCRRGCNGMTPGQIVRQLTGTVPEVRLLNDGVLIVSADRFPEQSEIVAMDRIIRDRLALPAWC